MYSQKQKFIYLSPPHMSGKESQYIEEAFLSNWISMLGHNVDLFEQKLAEYVGSKGAVSVCSGTAAIHLALRLLNVQAGDTVFCSTLSFTASANPILYQGAEPIFIDSEPKSWNMSPDALKRALEDAYRMKRLPKAVIVVNLYGQSADLAPIKELCDSYDVPIIEDAAESLGATYRGQYSGTIGKFGIYSFNGNKIITTSSGGMLVSDDTEALCRARFLSTQAREPLKHYEHKEIGYNYRFSNILAGIGRAQLEVLEDRILARRMVFQRYSEALSSIPGIEFMPETGDGRSTRWLTALTIDPDLVGLMPMEIVDKLAMHNIEARPVWKPLHLQPIYLSCMYYPHRDDHSVSEQLFARGICLPSGSNLMKDEQGEIIQLLKQMLREDRKEQGMRWENIS